MMMTKEDEIREIVDRETRAWSTRDVDLLLSVFHPDMVKASPPTIHAHDPVDWNLEMGRFDPLRWRKMFMELIETHDLVHNERAIQKITVSAEGDAAIAVVDIDTLWRDKTHGKDYHWLGRSCKMYTLTNGEWKMISHTGLLDYSDLGR